ncbi:PfkB family carbohydrate kinase [Microbacterium rhizophilus]|uniref:PfkB family carbohydrate kinase n=1 Tax=Microbacterium rhizophilus TaxID=3138934 RepID=UPI0031EE7788
MTGAPRVAVIGDALIDELRDPSGARDFVGGAALNVAAGLALRGVDATLIAMVGDDEPGDRIRAFLAEHGVTLIASESASGTARAVSDRSDGGEPRYAFNDAAKTRHIAFDTRARRALDAADLVVVSGFPFDDAGQARGLAEAVARPSARLVVDPNPRADLLRDRKAFLEGFERIAATALLVKVGDEDAHLLLDAPLSAFVKRLQRPGCGAAVLATAGAAGAEVHHGALAVRSGIVELPGPVVDTMGAGDATLVAVVRSIAAHGIARTEAEWRDALREAMELAAVTVRHEGALRRPPVVPQLEV